jgi:hypothetical protein
MHKKFKLVFTPEAVAQINAIVTWYNKQQKGLGTRFKNNLKKVLAATKQNPFTHSYRYDNVRCALPQKFPYAAHYTIDETNYTITIHAVFAFKENPDKWDKK